MATAFSLSAVPLDGALKLKLGSGRQECEAALGQNAALTEESVGADEIRYGGIFDGYYNSVVKLHFKNGKLALIRIELLQIDLREAFDEISAKISGKYPVEAVVDDENNSSLWSFDDTRYIKLYQETPLLVLEYADASLLSAPGDTSLY